MTSNGFISLFTFLFLFYNLFLSITINLYANFFFANIKLFLLAKNSNIKFLIISKSTIAISQYLLTLISI